MSGASLATCLGELADALNAMGNDGRRAVFYRTDLPVAGLHHIVGMPDTAALADDVEAPLSEMLVRELEAANSAPVTVGDGDGDGSSWARLGRCHGYLGCWAFPISAIGSELMGALAVFLPNPREPTTRDLDLAVEATRIAAIVMGRHRLDEQLAHAQAGLREAEARQAFLLKLSDALRPLDRADEIERAAVRLLGERLGADRVFYAGVDPDGEHWSFREDYSSGAALPPGRFPFSGYQRKRLPQWQAGQMSSIADSETDPNLDADDRADYAAFGARAAIGVPLVKHGGFAALLVANQAAPRAWTAAELALVREAAERTWAAMERARVEAALRESEARYHALFAASPVPVMVLDANPPDFTILAANDAYYAATLTTPDTLIGRRLFDVFTDDPARPGQLGPEALALSLSRVLDRKRTDAMERVRCDLVTPDGFEPHWWLAINAPLLDGDGNVTAIIHQVDRQTEQHLREEADCERRDHQSFVLRLTDMLRSLSDPARIKADAMRALGEHLGLDRAQYYEADATGEYFEADDGYARDALAVTRRERMHDLEPYVRRAFDTGPTVPVDQVSLDPPVGAAGPDAFAPAPGAFIAAPLVKDGRWIGAIGLQRSTAHPWTAAEIALAEEVAERVWAAVQRARAEERIRKSEERLQWAMNAIGAASFVWDPQADAAEFSGPLAALVGLADEVELTLTSALDHFHPDSVEPFRQAITDLLDPTKPDRLHLEVRVVGADGEERWLEKTARIHRVDGATRVAGMIIDVTDRKRAEVRLRENDGHLRTLVAELQHRVRNILTVTRLTFARTFEQGEDMDEMASHFRGRLDAMARTQVMLSRTASRSADLEDLIRDELLSVGATEQTGVTLDGPAVELDHQVAESLGMALHELTTNALKYGALRVPGGTLDVRWKTHMGEGGGRLLDLVWQERGVPAVSVRPLREGFGRELIEEALPYRVGATTALEFVGGGVRCSISVPLAEPSVFAAAQGETQ